MYFQEKTEVGSKVDADRFIHQDKKKKVLQGSGRGLPSSTKKGHRPDPMQQQSVVQPNLQSPWKSKANVGVGTLTDEENFLLIPQAGKIQNLNLHEPTQSPLRGGRRIGWANTQKQALFTSIPTPQPIVRHESANYLQLRENKASWVAKQRNRQRSMETMETLLYSPPKRMLPSPTQSLAFPQGTHVKSTSPTTAKSTNINITWLHASDAQAQNFIVAVAKNKESTQDDMARDLKVHQVKIEQYELALRHEREKAEEQKASETKRIQRMISTIRSSIGSIHVFTPIYKIWFRFKSLSALAKWKEFTATHRQYQLFMIEQTHRVVRIQRCFRKRRGFRVRSQMRQAQRRKEYVHALLLQKWFRAWHAKQEKQKRKEAFVARRLQAVWRGRVARKHVKVLLHGKIRSMLRFLSPTGAIHRLHDVSTGYPLDLQNGINEALMVLEESPVCFEVHQAKAAPTSSSEYQTFVSQHLKNATSTSTSASTSKSTSTSTSSLSPSPSKLSTLLSNPSDKPCNKFGNLPDDTNSIIKEEKLVITLHHMHETIRKLNGLLLLRTHEIGTTKLNFEYNRRLRQSHREEGLLFEKNLALFQSQERNVNARERSLMEWAERETREYNRNLEHFTIDEAFRKQRKLLHQAFQEGELMESEEHAMRHYLAETKRRRLDEAKRRKEVIKQKAYKLNIAREAMQERQRRIEVNRMILEERRQIQERKYLEEKRRLKEQSFMELEEMWMRIYIQSCYERDAAHREQLLKEMAMQIERDKVAELEKKREQGMELLNRERRERAFMLKEEHLSIQVETRPKRFKSAESWEQRWEAFQKAKQQPMEEDALEYVAIQSKKEMLEKERRERLFMEDEDRSLQQLHAIERKHERLNKAREKRLFRDRERLREERERRCMAEEEERERNRLKRIVKEQERVRLLASMKIHAEHQRVKEVERLLEAKCRKLMYDEEMSMRRWLKECHRRELIREEKERLDMQFLEEQQRRIEAILDARAQRRRERKARNEMNRCDIVDQRWNLLLKDGERLENLLWTPLEAAVLRHAVTHYVYYLMHNVQMFKEFVPRLRKEHSPLPLSFQPFTLQAKEAAAMNALQDVDGGNVHGNVHVNVHDVNDVHGNDVEDDVHADDDLNRRDEIITISQLRWRRAYAFVSSKHRARRIAKKAHACLQSNHVYHAVQLYVQAFTLGDTSSFTLRYMAKSHWLLWKQTLDRNHLAKSFTFYQKASQRIELLSTPAFLFELAIVLEAGNKYSHAMEILARIIQVFPAWPRLPFVIFRAGVLMFQLKMYEPSRQYLLHTMEAPPGSWKEYEILLLVARIYELEGKKLRYQAACEDAYRMTKDDKRLFGRKQQQYRGWKPWMQSFETWQYLARRYFEQGEYILARDAYEQTLLRLGRAKRQAKNQTRGHHVSDESGDQHDAAAADAADAREINVDVDVNVDDDRRKDDDKDDDNEKEEEAVDVGDLYLQLAKCHTFLNDRHGVQTAVKKWLSFKSYRNRIEEKMMLWDLSKWTLLAGLTVLPEKILNFLNAALEKDEREESKRPNENGRGDKENEDKENEKQNQLTLSASPSQVDDKHININDNLDNKKDVLERNEHDQNDDYNNHKDHDHKDDNDDHNDDNDNHNDDNDDKDDDDKNDHEDKEEEKDEMDEKWEKIEDPNTGEVYYWNEASQETRWAY